VHLVGFIVRNFVTMHGHMNVKFVYNYSVHLTLMCVSIKQDIKLQFHFSTYVSEFSTIHYSMIITPLRASFIELLTLALAGTLGKFLRNNFQTSFVTS
jgi:hypothetical protein